MQSGELIGTNVRLERLLSEGGMGSVWVAEHLTLNTQVAVKFMATEMAQHLDALARFKREASAAAQIRSPHIVQVFDHGVTGDGIPYIVMELLHGEDLDVRLGRGPLSLRETVQVITQSCKALGRAHKEGIVHRDIKPANIFLMESDGDIFVKVLDFGIAKRTVDHGQVLEVTRTGTMMGTPKFMSPEQMLSSKDIDFRSDLWSLGVVAYACLTTTVPFMGETLGALSVAVNAAKFTPAGELVPGLPLAVDAWFMKALARYPDARFGSAKEMGEALASAVPKDVGSSMHPARFDVPESRPATDDVDARLRMGTGPTAMSTTLWTRSPRVRLALVMAVLVVVVATGAFVALYQMLGTPAPVAADPSSPPTLGAPPTAEPPASSPVPSPTAPPVPAPSASSSPPADRSPGSVHARPPSTAGAPGGGQRAPRPGAPAATTPPGPSPAAPAPTPSAVVKDRGF